MNILIDTNVILDILGKRAPFFQDSYAALQKAIKEETECLVSVSARQTHPGKQSDTELRPPQNFSKIVAVFFLKS